MTTVSSNSKYTLENVNRILFEGFDCSLSENTLKIISDLTSQVSSPTYVKTPVFPKQTIGTMSGAGTMSNGGGGGGGGGGPMSGGNKIGGRKNRRDRPQEIIDDVQWETIKTPIIEKKTENKQVVNIRILLNKLTDRNYLDVRNNIFDILAEETIVLEELQKLISIIFEIASSNRFYSKIYADLCSDLSNKYDTMTTIITENINTFTELFHTIEYVDSMVDYDRFCEINKKNEKRKSLATFYLNMMKNGIIDKQIIINIMVELLSQFELFISQDDKRNEVDEITETVAILYNKTFYEGIKVNDKFVNDFISTISTSKVKDYKSLTSKTLFKFMDLIEK